MDHSLTTPEVESTTTNKIKLLDVTITLLQDDNGPLATVQVEHGEQDGETYTVNKTENIRLTKTEFAVAMDLVVTGGDTSRQALERAVFKALEDSGKIGAGTVS